MEIGYTGICGEFISEHIELKSLWDMQVDIWMYVRIAYIMKRKKPWLI